MNNFDLRKYLAEGGLRTKLNENLDPDPELYPDGYDFGELEEGEDKDVKIVADLFLEKGDDDSMEEPMTDEEVNESFLDEMARGSNTFTLNKDINLYGGEGKNKNPIRSFMNKVNILLKVYKTEGQKKPKSRFEKKDMDNLEKVLKQKNFTSKEVLNAIEGWEHSAQANTFLKVLEDKGYIRLTSVLKKSTQPERDPNAPETRGRPKKVKDEDGEDNKKKDKEPTDAQIRKAAKKAGLDENDRFLNEFLSKKTLIEIQSEEEVANLLDDFYQERINTYPNVETFADEVRTALDALTMRYSNDVDM
jgi:hypothetical protein